MALTTVSVPTKRVRRFAGSIPFASGEPANPLRLPQSDYLVGIELQLAGTMTCIGIASNTLLSKGPAGLAAGVVLNINGSAIPLSADGFGHKLLSLIDDPGTGFPEIAPVTSSASPGTANTWAATIPLKVGMSEQRNDLRGAVWCGSSAINATLEVTWATESQVVGLGSGNTATFSGAINVYTISMNAPAPTPPTKQGTAGGLWAQSSWLHLWTKKQFSAVSTGDNTIDLDTGNIITRLAFAVKNNGTYATDVVDHAVVNIQDLVQTDYYDKQSLRSHLVSRYRFPFDSSTGLPYVPSAAGATEFTGVYVIDFFETFTDRDEIDLRGVSQASLIVTIPSSASLVSPTLDLYQEQLVPLSAPITLG